MRLRNNLYIRNERKPIISYKTGSSQIEVHDKFRYFQTCEYGEQTFRKHYHVCLTNIDAFDKLDVEAIYNSWCDSDGEPIGIFTLDGLLPARIRYTVEYISYETPAMSKMYKALGLKPLFHSMSKGIGSDWVYAHADEIRATKGYYSNGTLRPLPRYYQDKLGMITVNEYVNRLDDIWKSYNDLLVVRGDKPVNPFDVRDMIRRGLFDRYSPDFKRSVLQWKIGNQQKEIHALKKEALCRDRRKKI